MMQTLEQMIASPKLMGIVTSYLRGDITYTAMIQELHLENLSSLEIISLVECSLSTEE